MEIDLQPSLEDSLVVLKPLLPSDFEALYTVGCDPLIWEQHQDKLRHTRAGFSTFFQEAIDSGTALKILLKEDQRLIGSSRYRLIDLEKGVVEIGWSFLARAYWGGSYNRAFKRLMINYALTHFNKVVFYVNENNFRSQKAVEKLGGVKIENGEASWTLDRESRGITYLIENKLS